MPRKKKILFMSDSSFAKTGFGRNTKEILFYLYKTGKYDIVEYAGGRVWSLDYEHQRKPWKSFGTIPDNQSELNLIAPSDQEKRLVSYGAHYLDKIIYQEKPDVVFAVQDIWGIDFVADRDWFDKVTTVFWTTLDSLPIIKSAIDLAPKVKNFWVWSNFAEKAMKKQGLSNVKTVHGAISSDKFFRLKDKDRTLLREKFSIPLDAFIAGFVFRNQPRKSVPNLINGYKLFRQDNPNCKNPRLLLHTHWNEGWRIHELADEYNIPHNEILTTYICSQCHDYIVRDYIGENIQCPYCKHNSSLVTTSPGLGVSENQLNEIYNLMDIYLHSFNSGGLEIPIVEAKYTELITAVTSYSCGEEMSQECAGSLPLDYSEYREPDSQFIKASTFPSSIAKQMSKIYKMPLAERQKQGKESRNWAISQFSVPVIGKYIENFIDESPFAKEYQQIENNPNPNAQVDKNLSDEDFIVQLISQVIGKKVDKYDSSVRMYKMQLERKINGLDRDKLENGIRNMAMQQLQNREKKKIIDEIKADNSKKIAYVIPASERDVYLSSSLFKSIKSTYPEYKLYVATSPQYFNIISGHPSVDKVIPYFPEMDNLLFMEGCGEEKGLFDLAYLPFLHTQRNIDYIHNGLDKINFNI